jgi:hypothetical protein
MSKSKISGTSVQMTGCHTVDRDILACTMVTILINCRVTQLPLVISWDVREDSSSAPAQTLKPARETESRACKQTVPIKPTQHDWCIMHAQGSAMKLKRTKSSIHPA